MAAIRSFDIAPADRPMKRQCIHALLSIDLAFDTFVSQVHARAFDRDGALWVEDLGSRNGTFVNEQPVHEPTYAGKGARIRVGETVLEVDR